MAMNKYPMYGMIAEFVSPDELIEASRHARDAGFRKIDAFSPFPIEGLGEALGLHHTKLPLLVFGGGLAGCITGFLLQVYPNVWGYPLNIGGKPHYSWPSFIPVTFELTILFAVLTSVFGMLALNGFPMPYHPVFNVERFGLASRDRFFLCIMSEDEKFNPVETKQFLEGLNARSISEIPY